MKIKNIITVLTFALLPLSAFAWGVATISGGVAAGITCTDENNFDTSDGTNIASVTNWDGSTNSDNFEIDTAQYHGGSGSFMLVGGDYGSAVRTITERTTGTFTISFWHRIGAYPGYEHLVCTIALNDGASEFMNLTIRGDAGDIYRNADTDTGANCSEATWAKVEIEVNLAADTYNVWWGGTQIVTNAAATNTTLNPDRVLFERWSNYDGTPATQWYDDFCVYDGSRQE